MSELLPICPRCGNPHDIEIRTFQKTMVIHNIDKKHQQSASRWAMCPISGEPILFWDVPDHWVRISRPLLVAEQRIRSLAHFLWEYEGKPEGRADLHWAYAEAALSEYFFINGIKEDRDEMANEFKSLMAGLMEAQSKNLVELMDRKILEGYPNV